MNLDLSEEQQQIQDLARDFAQNEILPKAAHHDRTGEYPLEIIKKAWEIGLTNVHIPESCGGMGFGVLEDSIISEELGAACTGISTAIEANSLAEAPIIVGASEEQKKEFLAPMTEECLLASYCVTEPGAGSDVQGIKTTATKVGNDYVINGTKMWITGAGYANWFFVLAYTDKEKGFRGMTAFYVPTNLPGISIGKKEQNMGQRASDTREVVFDNVVIPEKYRIAGEGKGWFLAMSAFDHTRPSVAAGAVGLARSAMEHSIRYALERKAFGAPIARYQAISFMIADMAKDIEAARLLVYKASYEIDKGRKNSKFAAMAKVFAADAAMRISTDAVQVFGGYGYSNEYPVEKLMRDAKVFQIYEGTSQIQRIIISKELFSRRNND
ncbi:acyl-CoA dehydrogenase family protein [bacterium]|nr:acyl-CoA dehydrogenase family protein [bacterium]